MIWGKGAKAFKSRKGFGFDTEGKYKVRPSNNTTIRDLLGDDRFTEAVLEFLMETKMKGAFKRDQECVR